jgi:ethanolamine-phosphate phospho-lyase
MSAYKFDGKGGAGRSANVLELPLPNLYKGKFNNGEAYADEAIALIEEAIAKNNKPCAFIAESISGCGGQVPLAPGYFKKLKTFLDAHQIVTIVDEVQTGFGRLGKWFWGFEMHEIIPDIVVLGKPMGNGHPIAAVVTTNAIADAFANGMEFFSSFGGNPVACAAANTMLTILETENLQANANEVGIYFKAQLKDLQSKYACIGDVRGEGLFLGIEFTTAGGQPDAAMAKHVKEALKNNFILTGTDGPFENVLKIKPPMCFSKENVEAFVGVLEKVLCAVV